MHTTYCIVVNCCLPRHKAIQKTTNYLKWLVKLFPEAVEPKRLSFIKWEKDCRELEDRGLLFELVENLLGTFWKPFVCFSFFFFLFVLFQFCSYLRRESEGVFCIGLFMRIELRFCLIIWDSCATESKIKDILFSPLFIILDLLDLITSCGKFVFFYIFIFIFVTFLN